MDKAWYHVIASVVGLVTAGLIVFLVFGNASKQGAAQESAAPTSVGSGMGQTLCGKVAPSDALSPKYLAKVDKNMPTIINEVGTQIAGFAPVEQKAWLARVVASSGFCLDEIEFTSNSTIKLSISSVEGMSEQDISAFTGAAIVFAHQPPLNRRVVKAVTFVGGQKRSITMSQRAASTFNIWRKLNNSGTSVSDIIRFSKTARLGSSNLQILGW